MADKSRQDGDRPSFTNFWKKSKEAFTGKQITFLPAATTTSAGAGPGAGGGGGGGGGGPSVTSPGEDDDGDHTQDPSQQGLSAQEKAQLRRAQVRKAQIQHRQRKANYIKQLELDVVRVRDMISQAERETTVLRRQNEGMKAKIRAAGVASPQRKAGKLPAPTVAREVVVPNQLHDHVNNPPPSADTELFSDINVNDITVTLSMDQTMGTPCYKISTTSSSSSASGRSATSPRSEGKSTALSVEQEDHAINFILALEYICWDHFHLKDFPTEGDPAGRECCHTLMASTYCMSSAPENIYKDRRSFKRLGVTPRSPPAPLSWQGSGLTLQNLRGLAASLNPGDKELTPVQAWFELAAHYPATLLLDASVVESLKREFVGVVRCVKYGATIERQAFESIVGRVMARFAPPDEPDVSMTG